MSNIEKYDVWHKAVDLAWDVIQFSVKDLFVSKNFGIKDQIQRSALSVPSNIAEWADRQTDKEFVRYLYIARWSLTELKTQLYTLSKKKLIETKIYETFHADIQTCHKMINWLIKTISKSI